MPDPGRGEGPATLARGYDIAGVAVGNEPGDGDGGRPSGFDAAEPIAARRANPVRLAVRPGVAERAVGSEVGWVVLSLCGHP